MAAPQTLHASCVAVEGKGLLILGSSGSGKSTLALDLISRGAALVADDRVILNKGTPPSASAPPQLEGLIEARNVGVLKAQAHGPAPISLAINLDEVETERVPERRVITLLGQNVPLLRGKGHLHLAPSLLQLLKFGRAEV